MRRGSLFAVAAFVIALGACRQSAPDDGTPRVTLRSFLMLGLDANARHPFPPE
jgi:hypothetical protein